MTKFASQETQASEKENSQLHECELTFLKAERKADTEERTEEENAVSLSSELVANKSEFLLFSLFLLLQCLVSAFLFQISCSKCLSFVRFRLFLFYLSSCSFFARLISWLFSLSLLLWSLWYAKILNHGIWYRGKNHG